MDEQKLVDFRKRKNDLFKTSDGPLTSEQRGTFRGLSYYSPNPNLVFNNLPIEQVESKETVEIQTSAGDSQSYKKIGKIHFTIEGKDYSLSLYKDTDFFNPTYFLPFKDATSGKETYGAGRYMDIEVRNNVISLLDFNYAYNPYCAYNENWRCPLTPEENRLLVPIEAGEKKFHE